MSDQATPPPEYLSVEEAADLLRVNRKTILRAVRERTLPGVLHLGRTIRIRRDALTATPRVARRRS